MSLEFKEVTPNNWRKINSLGVKEDQKKFVASNVAILAKAFAYGVYNSKVYALYIEDSPIGLIMQRDFANNDNVICILDQVMIDKDYQGKGYGKTAIKQWISKIEYENRYDLIMLCYDENDFIAEKMYKSLGFVRKPEEDDENELVMVYKL